MSAMAVADLAMVDVGLLRQWVYFVFDVDIRAQTSFGCKLHIMLTYYTHQVYRSSLFRNHHQSRKSTT